MIADLCLVLLLDASGSVDADEWRLQAEATAAAISSPEVVDRITRGGHGRILVSAFEFSTNQAQIAPWTVIESAADAGIMAGHLTSHQRQQSGATAPGAALSRAGEALRAVPAECVRRVVDISGDGTGNGGDDLGTAVAAAQAMDVMVNAIVIEDEPGVLDWYRQAVSGFTIPATWESYAEAIKRKLQLEIAGLDGVLLQR